MPRTYTNIIPMPPSVNALYCNAKHGQGRFKSPAYKAWRSKVELYRFDQGPPMTGPIVIKCAFGIPKTRRWDVPNMDKAIYDLLQVKGGWGVYQNDKQIVDNRNYLDPTVPEGMVRIQLVELEA